MQGDTTVERWGGWRAASEVLSRPKDGLLLPASRREVNALQSIKEEAQSVSKIDHKRDVSP
jgi:hypothetical protein